MGPKKKRKPRKNGPKAPQPLLVEQGILHLRNSFIPPASEMGLLSTVDRLQEPAAAFAPSPACYGYGKEELGKKPPVTDETVPETVTLALNTNSSSNDARGESNDAAVASEGNATPLTNNVVEEKVMDEQTMEFYSSLGRPSCTQTAEKEVDIQPVEAAVPNSAEEQPNPVESNEVVLEQYWQYVKKNPYDFHTWSYLIQHGENMDDILVCRQIYNAFLPLYPYCYAYWKRYSDLEKQFNFMERAIAIMEKGLEAIPLSADLWMSYLNLYCEIHKSEDDLENLVRRQYERAVRSVGPHFHCDFLWEAFIKWESDYNNLAAVTALYRRLLRIPTRLYNRHWDNFIAHVRDHHPRSILEKDEYNRLRKEVCKDLGMRYQEEADFELGEILRVTRPEDKLTTTMKERILADIIPVHEKSEKESQKRWKFEEKIKRPYFHIKALDKKQLKNWDDYLDLEKAEGDHNRIVLLYERCLIACAYYEEFWHSYADYLDKYYTKKLSENSTEDDETRPNEIDEKSAPSTASGEKLENIKLTKNEEQADAENSLQSDMRMEETKDKEADKDAENSARVRPSESDMVAEIEKENIVGASASLGSDSRELPPKEASLCRKSPPSASHSLAVLGGKFLGKGVDAHTEAVRNVFKRACYVHCPTKSGVRLKWAAFEEERGNIQEARDLITQVLQQYPDILEAHIQLVELERRQDNLDTVKELYEKCLQAMAGKNCFSWLAIKYSRFLFKILGLPDKALAILRVALKKDQGNRHLYMQVIDVCYQRFPIDIPGVTASLELALKSKELGSKQKLEFVKKKVSFMKEFGDLASYQSSLTELKTYMNLVESEEKAKEENKSEMNSSPSLLPSELLVLHPVDEKPVDKKAAELVVYPPPAAAPGTNPPTVQNHHAFYPTEYHQVAPTWDLYYNGNFQQKDSNEDSLEEMKSKQYEALHRQGYVPDPREIPQLKRKAEEGTAYVIPPKAFIMENAIPIREVFTPAVPGTQVMIQHVMPPNIHKEQNPACLNIPEWFVREGGSLCLSDGPDGTSTLQYWPNFMSEKGNHRMFDSLRNCVKWHQKKVFVNGQWRPQPRLISWFGPCDYSYSGMVMSRNENWPPDLLDLIHRLIGLSGHEFNSCFMNLYRSGHDSVAWHSDEHPALGRNPPVASISLGAIRMFELRRKHGPPDLIRFPLFPGSLLLMLGATQEDWVHQIPKDPQVKEERINLTFRIMFAID